MKEPKMDNERTLFKVIPGGPLEVSGPKRIKGPDGRIIKNDETLFLCRCGNSSNKPYCDDSHKRNGISE